MSNEVNGPLIVSPPSVAELDFDLSKQPYFGRIPFGNVIR